MRVEKGRAAGARRGLGCLGASLIALIVIMLVALLSSALFVMSKRDNASASFLQAQSNAVPWNQRDRLNVLLLRSDGALGPSTSVTSVMIASFDPHAQSLRLLSLPDNLWMTIPGYGPNRLGMAYAEGGPRTALLAAQSATHIVIPYYAVLDGPTFARLVDALGGVSLPMAGAARTAFHLDTRSGPVHLDGHATLRYLTGLHHDPFGQDDRLKREQDLYLAVERGAMQPQHFFQIPTIVSALGGSIQTNFPYDEVPALAHMLLSLPRNSVHTEVVSHASSSVTDYWGGGQRVLLPDWQRITALSQGFCSCRPPASAHGVTVLNGTDTPGQAARLSDWLRQSGVRVARIGTAPSTQLAHSRVLLAPQSSPQARVQAQVVATLLQAPIVTGRVATFRGSVVVLIGQDFQAPFQQ